MMKSSLKKTYFSLAIFFLIFEVACNKFVEVEAPSNSLNGDNVYTQEGTAIAVQTNIYSDFSIGLRSGSLSSITVYSGLCADELRLFDGTSNPVQEYIPYYQNSLTALNVGPRDLCSSVYNTIYVCNSEIEKLSIPNNLSVEVSSQLLGEAHFTRAFCYFYLVNCYGEIPLALTSDYRINNTLPKSDKNLVYNAITNDLIISKSLLSKKFLSSNLKAISSERVRPTYWAAAALLARVYLYLNKYNDAIKMADTVINNNDLFELVSVDNVYKNNNREAIWQLQPVQFTAGGIARTQEASLFMLPKDVPISFNEHPIYLDNNIILSFENGDLRKENWIDSVIVDNNLKFFPTKYKQFKQEDAADESSVVFRLAELYLIRSECKSKIGDINGARSDLNVIRLRAGLNESEALNESQLMAAIIEERKLELFTEWGHRWLDLKRLNLVDDVMQKVTPTKQGQWKIEYQYYPFRINDIQRNPNLIQNPGYN